MLIRYRNELRAHIKRAEVNPDFFVLEELTDDITTVRLTHVPMRFEFLQSATSFDDFRFRYCLFAPGFPFERPSRGSTRLLRHLFRLTAVPSARYSAPGGRPDDLFWMPTTLWVDFESAISRFDRWLTSEALRAVTELTMADLWVTAESAEFTGGPADGDDRHFSEAEQRRVRTAIEQFRLALIDEYQPDPAQLGDIDERLKYLSDAVARLNVFDWKALAATTLVGVALNLSLDSSKGQELWHTFLRALASVSHLLSG